MGRHSTKGKVELLREVPLFSACTDKELARIDALVDEVAVDPGTVLIHEGRPGQESFVIASGEAEVTLRGQHLAIVGPGAVVGEMAVIDRQPRSATVVAKSAMKVLVLDPRSLSGLLAQGSVTNKVLRDMSKRLRAVEGAPTYPAAGARP